MPKYQSARALVVSTTTPSSACLFSPLDLYLYVIS